MKTMTVNEETNTVEVAAGVRAGEVTAEVQKYGLAVPIGTASNPGAFGVALSGGIGYLRGVYGLAERYLDDVIQRNARVRQFGACKTGR